MVRREWKGMEGERQGKRTAIKANGKEGEKKARQRWRAWEKNPGSDLLSHTVSRAVPSALEVLTTEFGMGSGVAPPVWLPRNGKRINASMYNYKTSFRTRGPYNGPWPSRKKKMVKPHGRLVPVSSTHCCASTPGLLPRGLRGAFRVLRPGRPNLEVGFPLRCFQRLSSPDVATRRCRWCDNRHTRGQSNPVLSY
jgi:hypothetical protein